MINHDGGIPGFSSQAWFLPSDGLAVFTVMNVETTASYNVALRVTEDALGVPLTDPQSRQSSSAPTKVQPCDTNSTINLDLFEATYMNPGYGDFSLCAALSNATYCASVLEDFTPVSPNHTLDSTTLYGSWSHDRVWAKQLLVQRAQGVACSMSVPGEGEEIVQLALTAVTAYPQGFGRDQTPFVYAEAAPPDMPVECIVRANGSEVVGCGLMNIGLMDNTWMARTGSVQERADAWFARV